MALPKNKGIRKITVNNQKYYWAIGGNRDFGTLMARVGFPESPNKFFVFHVKYKDFWSHFPEKVDNEIDGMTPGLVRKAIEFANNNFDWQDNDKCVFKYENGEFGELDFS